MADQLHVYLQLPRREHRCPCCGAVTDRIHDFIKDIPLGRTTFLHLRKRRYRCSCGKRFFENNTFLPRYYRATSRLIAQNVGTAMLRDTVNSGIESYTQQLEVEERINNENVEAEETQNLTKLTVSIQAGEIVVLYVGGLLLAWIAVIAASVSLFRLKPREILSKMS